MVGEEEETKHKLAGLGAVGDMSIIGNGASAGRPTEDPRPAPGKGQKGEK